MKDLIFQERLKSCLEYWTRVADYNTCILEVWEWIIKPGICKLAKYRQREIQDQHLGILQILFVKQSMYTSQLQSGDLSVLHLLCFTQLEIENHYEVEARTEESASSEKTRIFHHSLIKRNIQISAILKLDTAEGRKTGHFECFEYLEREVVQLLASTHSAVPDAEDYLLNEISEVYTEEDNELLLSLPTENELKAVIDNSNLNAALGLDGILGLAYSVCWDILKDPLLKVLIAVHNEKHPTAS